MGFGEVVVEVLELPTVGIELDQLVVADRITEAKARFHERSSGPGAHRPPAIVIQQTVPEHLKVLGEMPAGCDRSTVRPMTPGNAWPGPYSSIALGGGIAGASPWLVVRAAALESITALELRNPERPSPAASGRP